MPEILTKHPDIVIKVLESAGAKCGDGVPQKILTQCPSTQFCALPKGEICVYGTQNISSMTQIKPVDLVSSVFFTWPIGLALLIVFFMGVLVGKLIFK
jgi:hypothetical protein